MSNLPWMFQTHVADAKVKQFEAALQTIAGREQVLQAMAPDQALATLHDATKIARAALERQGLTGTAWEWVAADAVQPSVTVNG